MVQAGNVFTCTRYPNVLWTMAWYDIAMISLGFSGMCWPPWRHLSRFHLTSPKLNDFIIRMNYLWDFCLFWLQTLQQTLSYAADTKIVLCRAKMKYHRPLNIVVCEFDDIFILKNRTNSLFSTDIAGFRSDVYDMPLGRRLRCIYIGWLCVVDWIVHDL